MTDKKGSSVPAALQDWRAAERVAAVARRGRLAAEEASAAAQEAAIAATATAKAAKTALESMSLAEASALKTATAAKLAALSMASDLADSVSESALADVDETEAQARYREATGRAAKRET